MFSLLYPLQRRSALSLFALIPSPAIFLQSGVGEKWLLSAERRSFQAVLGDGHSLQRLRVSPRKREIKGEKGLRNQMLRKTF